MAHWRAASGTGPGAVLGTGVLPVTEVGPNLFQSTITAVQSTLTAFATAQSAANSILDLTPLDEIIMASGIIEASGNWQTSSANRRTR